MLTCMAIHSRVCLIPYCLKTETRALIQGSFITFFGFVEGFLAFKTDKKVTSIYNNCATTYQSCFKKRRSLATWVEISEIATGVLLCFAITRTVVLRKGLCRLLS